MLSMIRHSLTVKRCGTDIAKSTLEALSGMAFDLFRNQTQKNSLTERLSLALKSMLKVSKKEQMNWCFVKWTTRRVVEESLCY